MRDYKKDPTPQYEKSKPATVKPVKITHKIIAELVEIVRENKALLKKADIKYQL